MPDGVAVLERLGVELDRCRTFPLRGIRYLDEGLVAAGEFPRGIGLGVRRRELQAAMARRAGEAGVELLWGTTAAALAEDGVSTVSGSLPAGWVVAADGLHSRLRRWSGLDGPPARRRRFGVRRHYAMPPWSDFVEVYWASGCEAYVTPVGGDLVGVAMLWGNGKAAGGFDTLLKRLPALARRLSGAPVVSRDLGAGPFEQRVRGVFRGRLALVGDASGYVDAITGEGLSLAFHQASAVVEAIVAGDLRRYAESHRAIGRLPNAITHLVLAIERRPWLRRRAIAALAAEPAVFSRLLGVHSRSLALADVGVGGALRLVRGLVAAGA